MRDQDLELTTRHVNFLLVLVRQDPRQAETIREVVRIVQEHRGMIQSITGALITVYKMGVRSIDSYYVVC